MDRGLLIGGWFIDRKQLTSRFRGQVVVVDAKVLSDLLNIFFNSIFVIKWLFRITFLHTNFKIFNSSIDTLTLTLLSKYTP